MKKIKLIHLIIVILVVIGIIFGVSQLRKGNNKDKKRLAEIYQNLDTSQTYLFEMEQSSENKTIMAKKEDKTIIDQYTEDNRITTLVKDDNTYLILHNREEYYVYEQNNVDQNILTDGLAEVVSKEFVTGEEKVRGKKYSYEEFSGSTMFMVTNTLDVDEESVKTRFYFDKNDNLVYIKTIFGEMEEVLKIKLEQEVDDAIFEIPSNYAEN